MMPPRTRATVGIGEKPDVLLQDVSGKHSTWAILAPMMLKFTRYDDLWRPWAEMAAEIPSYRAGTWRRDARGRVLTEISVRPGLFWHDGKALTAGDAVASLQFLRGLDEEYPHREIVAAVEDVEAVGTRLVTTWSADAPVGPFEEWGSVFPVHLLSKEERLMPRLESLRRLAEHPISHGPFQCRHYDPGISLSLTRSEVGHPLGRPELESLEFLFFDDPGSLREAVISGCVDVTELSGFSDADVDAITSVRPHHKVSAIESSLWEHIDLNLDDKFLADPRVRLALLLAIDRQDLVPRLYGRHAAVTESWLPARHAAHNASLSRIGFSLTAARGLLSESGYRLDSLGRLCGHDGCPIDLTIVTTAPGARWSAVANRKLVAEEVAKAWGRLGVSTRVEALPSEKAFQTFRSRQFPHAALFAWSIGPEANGYLMWHSSQIPVKATDYGLNVSGWRNGENDRILNCLVSEDDPECQRQRLLAQQGVWARELPSLPLTFVPQLNTYDGRLTPVKYVGMFGNYVTWNSWEWRWVA